MSVICAVQLIAWDNAQVGVLKSMGFLDEGISIVKELFRRPVLRAHDLLVAPQAHRMLPVKSIVFQNFR